MEEAREGKGEQMLLLLLLLLVLLVLLQLLLLLLLVLLVLVLVLVVLLVVLLLVLGEPQGLFGKLAAGLRGSHQKETPARGKCGNTAQKKNITWHLPFLQESVEKEQSADKLLIMHSFLSIASSSDIFPAIVVVDT